MIKKRRVGELPVSKKIEILQILRGYAAITVLCSHYFMTGKAHSNGQMGVAVFFLISGFVLVYSTRNKSLEGYWKKRARKLLPLYYLTTILVFILGFISPSLIHSSETSIKALIKSMLFIPYATEVGVYPLYPICWTLTVEVFVYLVYYLACILNKKKAGMITAIVLLLFTFLGQNVVRVTLFSETYGRIYMINFSIGMILAVLLPKFNKYRIEVKVPEVVTILGCVLFVVLSLYFEENLVLTICVGIVFCILVILGQGCTFHSLFVQFGNATYSFYLIHYFVVKGWLRVIMPRIGSGIAIETVGLIVCIGITAVLSQISYRLIESR